MKYIQLFLITLLVFSKSHCQKNTLISYELARGYDYVNYKSNSGQNTLNSASGIPMLILAQQLNKHFYIETGVASDYMEYTVGREIDSDNGITFYRNEIQIPLRVQYREHFLNEKLVAYLMPGINYSIGANEKNLKISDDSGITEFQMNKNYILGQIGIGTEYIINRHIFVGMRYQYDFGFNDNIKIKGFTNYNLPFAVNSKANSSVFGIYFGYRISNLWNKKQN